MLTFLLGSQMAEIEHFCALAQKMAQEGKRGRGRHVAPGPFFSETPAPLESVAQNSEPSPDLHLQCSYCPPLQARKKKAQQDMKLRQHEEDAARATQDR